MNKYIVCFDCETTGLNPKEEFIIQLAASKLIKETMEVVEEKLWYIKPSRQYSISPVALQKHGISKEYIEEHGVYFNEVAKEFLPMLQDADILTYNGNAFDIKFLYQECLRWGIELDLDNKIFYDSYAMECKFHPRDLEHVYNAYTGNILEGAHNAMNDIRATIEVFKKQREVYDLDYDKLDKMPENQMYSPDGTIRRCEVCGVEKILFNIGKYKDIDFKEVWKNDKSYIDWFLNNVASKYTINILNNYIKKGIN